MTSMDLLEIIGSIRDKYILDAEKKRAGMATAGKQKTRRAISHRIAAMIALVLAGILFLQTPMGVAAVEIVKESVSRLIETLFPPKDIIVMPEGTPEVVHHEAKGREPEKESPGFVMYVDTESYVMTEENGAYYVRQIPTEYDREEIRDQQAALLEGLSPEEQEAAIDARIQELKDFYAALPSNEIEIREVPNKEFSAYAEEIRNQMSTDWEITEELIWVDRPLAFTFSVSGGNSWDSPHEVHYFVDNGNQGTFHIVARYYLEAAEGLGTRFTSMIQTFEVVTSADTALYNGGDEDVLEAMRQQVDAAMEQNETILHAVQNNSSTHADLDAYAMERYEIWTNTLMTLWPAVEERLDSEGRQDLLASHLAWSTYEIELQNITLAQTQSQREYWNSGADMIEQRVYYLLNILEGTAPVESRDPSVQLSPEVVISQFMDAYFSDDIDTIKLHLSQSYDWVIDTYAGFAPGKPEIDAIKGLDDVVHNMAYWGVIHPSVQFVTSPESDSFVYLSMTLTWENNQWKVSEYGLEG